MKIGIPEEVFEGEARVALTPESALQLQKLGYACAIQSGAGRLAGFDDAAYEVAGVEVVKPPPRSGRPATSSPRCARQTRMS